MKSSKEISNEIISNNEILESQYVNIVHELYDACHLEEVVEQMQEQGSPIIRGVECNGAYYLLEGCHRTRAAAQLGIPIIIDLLDVDLDQDLSEIYDPEDLQLDPGTTPMDVINSCYGYTLEVDVVIK